MNYTVKQELTLSQIQDIFNRMGRGSQFTQEGLKTILDNMQEFDSDCIGIDLDVIGICCSWTEYDNEYSLENDTGLTLEEVEDYYTVLHTSTGGYVVSN